MAAVPNVLRKVKVDGAWKMLPVARDRHGALDWSRVMHKGAPIVAAAGTFYLEYFAPQKTRRAVGTHPRDAKAALASQTAVLALRARGVVTGDAPEIQQRADAAELTGARIDEVVREFVASPPVKLRPRSVAKYTEAMLAFGMFCRTVTRKSHVSQLGREDIDGFMAWLVRSQKLAMATAKGKGIIVISTMRAHGAEIQMRKGDWPQTTEMQPDVYKPETLKALFAAMTVDERDLFSTFLVSGLRDQEMQHLAWPDVDERGSLAVTAKPELGFAPKNYEERTVEIPPVQVKRLQARRRRRPGEYLVFGTSTRYVNRGNPGAQPDGKMLLKLKRIALRAGLNCGRCRSTWQKQPVTCATHPVCANFTLHMFRHTYATSMLRDGMDVVTLQGQMGHKDIDSTMKYLRMLAPESLREKVKSSSLAKWV
jgi:integrase